MKPTLVFPPPNLRVESRRHHQNGKKRNKRLVKWETVEKDRKKWRERETKRMRVRSENEKEEKER
jgi:hypothetical protein